MIRRRSEGSEQAALMEWAARQSKVQGWESLALLFHVPNGGSRNPAEAAHLKRQGVKSGVPDVVLPVPAGMYGSLYIEMKHGKNKPTENQQRWLDALAKAGNAVAVCYSADEAIATIKDYLGGKTHRRSHG